MSTDADFTEFLAAVSARDFGWAGTTDTVERLEDSEKLQRSLYAIADLASSDLDMPDMLRALHRIVSGLMYAENFYIALYDEGADALRFIYLKDTIDPRVLKALGTPAGGEVVGTDRY